MKKSKLSFIALSFATLMSVVACGGGRTVGTVEMVELSETDIGTVKVLNATAKARYSEANPLKIALVTDSGTLNDHSFNESAWNGVNAFAVANGGGTVSSANVVSTGSVQTQYYQPTGNFTTSTRLNAMLDAASWGADVIVLPGYLFQSTIARFQERYANNRDEMPALLALDCVAEDSDNNYAAFTFDDKVTSVIYREEQAGYLAGYAAVKEGYRNLGFVGGMAVPAVIRYGYGYVQGADAAAQDLELADDSIQMQYYYAGEFAATEAATNYATSWYNNGTEVIFACGGAVYNSVTTASQRAGNKPWIGVDVNQHADSEISPDGMENYCITSAMKNLADATQVLLATYGNNNEAWTEDLAGEVVTVGAQSLNVCLPTPESSGDAGCWRFKNFTVAEYEDLMEGLQSGEVKVNGNSDNAAIVAAAFGTHKVVVNYIEQ